MKIKYMLAATAMVATLGARPAIPAGYYNSCEGYCGQTLLSRLHNTISDFHNVGYDGLWSLYASSDVYPNGKIWDMYSTKQWTYKSEQCGTYKLVGDCYNREHSFPKSWFSEGAPMKSDAFHVIPTDGKVNGQRSNYPYGECANGTRLASNGDVRALGKLGSCTFSGYSGTVFEPDDEYKGDMARAYFYMAACYNDRIANWSSPMLAGNSYPCYTQWAVDLLLKWHRQDPVSQKELDRNEAVAAVQGNRNPFIDYPELAEYIWGTKKTTAWDPEAEHEAIINRPTDGSELAFGVTAVGVRSQRSLTVKGTNLTEAVNLSVSGSGFSLGTTTVAASAANSASGAEVAVYCNASASGSLAGTLTLTSGSASATISLSATAVNGLPVEAIDVSDTEFTVRWVCVGDELDGSVYSLDVRDSDGSLEGYPRSVSAAAETYTVTDLYPETEYSFTLSGRTLASNEIHVTTVSAIPSVDILFDGDLYFTADPGIPSAEAELFVDVDNIPGSVTLTVQAPFQLSTDHTDWATSVVLAYGQDRVYMRLFGEIGGNYFTSIIATADGYYNDDAYVEGVISAEPTFVEDFEPAGQSTYSTFTYQGTACTWEMNDAGFWSGDPAGEGTQSVRFGKKAYSSITMTEDKPNGVGVVEFIARAWTNDGDALVALEYSTDQGATWTEVGRTTVTGSDYLKHTFVLNKGGNVRLRVSQLTGARFLLDVFTASDCRSAIASPDPEVNSWDAWGAKGELVISSNVAQPVEVWAMDGTKRYAATLAPGRVQMSLPAGLYIVATPGFSRRVLVR